jgi:hypothetical protein
MPTKIIDSPSCSMTLNAIVESPPVVDYTTVTTRAIRVTRRVILRTYFQHLRFVDPSCLKKMDSLLAEYDNANNINDGAFTKLEYLFPVFGCPWAFSNSLCSVIVLGPIGVETSISGR